MNRMLARIMMVLIALALLAGTAYAQQIPMGPYFQTLKQDSSIADAAERGKELFAKLGCGGRSVNVAGQRVPIPIPALKGAAMHYPRLSMTGFAATIGVMNDL